MNPFSFRYILNEIAKSNDDIASLAAYIMHDSRAFSAIRFLANSTAKMIPANIRIKFQELFTPFGMRRNIDERMS